MPKPKAKAWLRESFRDGVDERNDSNRRYYNHRQSPRCWLAQHDPRRCPCAGPLERFHFIPRQRVENALDALLPPAYLSDPEPLWRVELILLAAWDPRNGGVGCEHHHRRFDNHATPGLVVPLAALPAHVIAFCNDYDFIGAGWFADRFPASGPSGSVGPVSRSIQSN